MFATDAYRQNPLTMTLTFCSSQASERLVRVLAYRLQVVMFQLLSDILEPLASCNGSSASTIDQRVTLMFGGRSKHHRMWPQREMTQVRVCVLEYDVSPGVQQRLS